MVTEATTDWRAARKARTRQRIQEVAVRLFQERGFDAVTVEEIAAAAGVSHMTVFRHFGTKEQIVLGDDYDPQIVAAIRQRPASEPALDSVERAMTTVLGHVDPAESELLLQRTQLIMTTPALRENLWAGWLETQEVLADTLASRQGSSGAPDRLALKVAAGLALVTATTAIMMWLDERGRRPLGELLSQAFAAARAEMAKTGTKKAGPV